MIRWMTANTILGLLALGVALLGCDSEPRHNAGCLELNIALASADEPERMTDETFSRWAQELIRLIEKQGVGRLTMDELNDLVRECHG